ncbi:MAG: TIGR04282 family arsenosugar biosynthesis glycosyltransferase [Thermocrispum sp.]
MTAATAPPCVLLIAKAPVPGFAKTRLTPPATPEQAAAIAAAGLLDTLDTVRHTGMRPIVALAGDLARAAASGAISAALLGCTVIAQRGTGLAERLVHAHADAAVAAPGAPILQIGSDTPHVTTAVLAAAAAQVLDGPDAVLGRATDGGWWALGLRDPRHAVALYGVPMSTADTGRLTHESLTARGLSVGGLPVLSDVDTIADARTVSRQIPGGRFARAVAAVA